MPTLHLNISLPSRISPAIIVSGCWITGGLVQTEEKYYKLLRANEESERNAAKYLRKVTESKAPARLVSRGPVLAA